ncbi:MAG: hypothetical protein NUV67_01040 [archaeon]|nr:hypothetical protein [archaeon]
MRRKRQKQPGGFGKNQISRMRRPVPHPLGEAEVMRYHDVRKELESHGIPLAKPKLVVEGERAVEIFNHPLKEERLSNHMLIGTGTGFNAETVRIMVKLAELGYSPLPEHIGCIMGKGGLELLAHPDSSFIKTKVGVKRASELLKTAFWKHFTNLRAEGEVNKFAYTIANHELRKYLIEPEELSEKGRGRRGTIQNYLKDRGKK